MRHICEARALAGCRRGHLEPCSVGSVLVTRRKPEVCRGHPLGKSRGFTERGSKCLYQQLQTVLQHRNVWLGEIITCKKFEARDVTLLFHILYNFKVSKSIMGRGKKIPNTAKK